MNRFRYRWQLELIKFVIGEMPIPLQPILENVEILAGYSPTFTGLYPFYIFPDGRTTDDCSHIHYPAGINRDVPVIVMNKEEPFSRYTHDSMVHEFGHAIHWYLGFPDWDIVPLWDYAETNRHEAFACSFTAWFYKQGKDCWGYGREELLRVDPATAHRFDILAASPERP